MCVSGGGVLYSVTQTATTDGNFFLQPWEQSDTGVGSTGNVALLGDKNQSLHTRAAVGCPPNARPERFHIWQMRPPDHCCYQVVSVRSGCSVQGARAATRRPVQQTHRHTHTWLHVSSRPTRRSTQAVVVRGPPSSSCTRYSAAPAGTSGAYVYLMRARNM